MSLTWLQLAAVEARIQRLADASGEPEHDWPWYYEGLRAQALRELGLTEGDPMEQPLPDQIVQALMHGDLSGLNDEQKLQLYQQTCASLGLNPLTNPLRYLELKEGDKTKLVLYTGKGCADQLRSNRQVSTELLSRTIEEGLCVVVARSKDASGRYVDDIGIVPLGKPGGNWKTSANGRRYLESDGTVIPLEGEARANAIMKAITKAKNRSTLSFCGLGMLDESEIDSIAGAVTIPVEGRPALPPSSAAEMNTTIQPEPAKVSARPFVSSTQPSSVSTHAPTPAQTNASGSASSAAAEGKSPERKPDDKPRLIAGEELDEALKFEFKRLAGSDQQLAADIARSVFGSAVDGWKKIEQLPAGSRRSGLKRLQAMQPERPPADPTPAPKDASPSVGASSASAEHSTGIPQRCLHSLPGGTDEASKCILPAHHAGEHQYREQHAEEDVPLHDPPPDGFQAFQVQEGPHVPPGGTNVNGHIQGEGGGSPDASEGDQEPSDTPLMTADNFVDQGDVRSLALYATMNEQDEVWFTMCEGRAMVEGTPVLSLPAYRAIKNMIKRGIGVSS